MTTPLYPTVWYWVVQDTNPTTQVWESATGQFVANNAANYLSWVANGGSSVNAAQIKVTGAADNGSGLIRLTVDYSSQMATNDRWVVQNVGGTTEANGRWPITVIDATHVDLQGSTFTHVFTSNGVIDRGTVIDTLANLKSVIDSYNQSLTSNAFGTATSSGATIFLSNPEPTWLEVTLTGGPTNLTLPQMNLFGSPGIGKTFYIQNSSSSTDLINVYNFASVLLFAGVQPGDILLLHLVNGNSQAGFIEGQNIQQVASPNRGGTGSVGFIVHSVLIGEGASAINGVVPTVAGQVFLDQGGSADPAFKAISGDGTLTGAGVLTVNKVKGNNPIAVVDGGTGDGGTAFATYTPSVSAGAGAFTTVSATGRWKQIGKIVFVEIKITDTTNGAAGGWVIASLPVAPVLTNSFALSGFEGNSGFLVAGNVSTASGGVANIFKYDGTFPLASGDTLWVSGYYEAA